VALDSQSAAPRSGIGAIGFAIALAALSSVFVAQPLLAVRRDFHHRGIAVEFAFARVAAGPAMRDRAAFDFARENRIAARVELL